MTTVLLNLHNAGLYELNSMILAMGISYGGAAQIVAGIMEWRKGNTFASTAFLSYGLFWLSLVTLIILAKLGWATPSNDTAMAAYLAMWGLFTAVMFIGTFRLHVAGQVVFGSLTILFFLLAIGDYIGAGPDFRHFTGYEGIFCGFSAISRRCSTKFSARSSCHSGRWGNKSGFRSTASAGVSPPRANVLQPARLLPQLTTRLTLLQQTRCEFQRRFAFSAEHPRDFSLARLAADFMQIRERAAARDILRNNEM